MEWLPLLRRSGGGDANLASSAASEAIFPCTTSPARKPKPPRRAHGSAVSSGPAPSRRWYTPAGAAAPPLAVRGTHQVLAPRPPPRLSPSRTPKPPPARMHIGHDARNAGFARVRGSSRRVPRFPRLRTPTFSHASGTMVPCASRRLAWRRARHVAASRGSDPRDPPRASAARSAPACARHAGPVVHRRSPRPPACPAGSHRSRM